MGRELIVTTAAGNIGSVPDVQLVIFDSDGMLVDSEVISNRVLATMLTSAGLPKTLAETRRDYQGLLLDEIVTVTARKFAFRRTSSSGSRPSALTSFAES